jgi:hypothetical protein
MIVFSPFRCIWGTLSNLKVHATIVVEEEEENAGAANGNLFNVKAIKMTTRKKTIQTFSEVGIEIERKRERERERESSSQLTLKLHHNIASCLSSKETSNMATFA